MDLFSVKKQINMVKLYILEIQRRSAMYIKNIHIENFRNFKYIDIPLNQFTI